VNLERGFGLFLLFVAAAALLFFVLAMLHAPAAPVAGKRFPSHLMVAGQALLGVSFVGQLTKLAFRQPMKRLDAVLPVTLFVAAVALLASLALNYWRLYRQSHP
jgi:hypothetical protein